MKKFTSIILSLLLIVSLSGCGNNNSTSSIDSKASQEKNNVVSEKNNSNAENKNTDKDSINNKTEDEKNVSDSSENTEDKDTEDKNTEDKDIVEEKDESKFQGLEVAGIDNPDEFEEMFNTVKKSVAEDNREKVAEYISYPVFHNNETTAIKTEEDFVKNYDKLFTEEIKKAIANENVQCVSWRGIAVGEGGHCVTFNQNGIYRIINDYDGPFDCEKTEEDTELVIEFDFSNEHFNEESEVSRAVGSIAPVVYRLLVRDILEKDEINIVRNSGLFGTMVSVMDNEECFSSAFNYYYPSNDFLKENAPSLNEFMEKLPKRISNTENSTKDNNILEKLLVFSEDINDDFKNKVIDGYSKIDYAYLKGLVDKGFKIKFQKSL